MYSLYNLGIRMFFLIICEPIDDEQLALPGPNDNNGNELFTQKTLRATDEGQRLGAFFCACNDC